MRTQDITARIISDEQSCLCLCAEYAQRAYEDLAIGFATSFLL